MSMQLGRKLKVKLTQDLNSNTGEIEFTEKFRIVFDIKRIADGTQPDTCNVKIYNVSHGNYRAFRKDPLIKMRCIISGGYEGKQGVIFKGDVTAVDYIVEGVDRYMMITCGDGVIALKKQIQKTYSNAQADVIANDIINQMKNDGIQIAKGAIESIKEQLTGKKEMGKTVLKESTKSALAKILKKNGLDYQVVNNELHVVDSVKKKINDFGVNLSSFNGLIGQPLRKKESMVTGKQIEMVTFDCLINPDIIPGREVDLDSKYLSGKYVTQNITISGDTFMGDWQMSCEAI